MARQEPVAIGTVAHRRQTTHPRRSPARPVAAVSDRPGTADLGWLLRVSLRERPQLSLQGKDLWRMGLTRVG